VEDIEDTLLCHWCGIMAKRYVVRSWRLYRWIGRRQFLISCQ